jgi:hypothetical protein
MLPRSKLPLRRLFSPLKVFRMKFIWFRAARLACVLDYMHIVLRIAVSAVIWSST